MNLEQTAQTATHADSAPATKCDSTETYDFTDELKDLLDSHLRVLEDFYNKYETSILVSAVTSNTPAENAHARVQVIGTKNSNVIPDIMFAIGMAMDKDTKSGLAVAVNQKENPQDDELAVFSLRDQATEALAAMKAIHEILHERRLPHILMLNLGANEQHEPDIAGYYGNYGDDRTPTEFRVLLAGATGGVDGMIRYGRELSSKFIEKLENDKFFRFAVYKGLV